MTDLLYWGNVKKERAHQEHLKRFSAEAPSEFAYVPNMSDDDNQRWKAKVTGQRKGWPQVEIRRSLRGSQMVLIVSLLGEIQVPGRYRDLGRTKANVSMSSNGRINLTWDEYEELQLVIEEAIARLQTYETG